MTINKRLQRLLRISALCTVLIVSQKPVCTQIVDQRWTNNASLEEKQQQWYEADSILAVYLKNNIECHRADILQQDSSIYLLPDGTFDVYIWHRGRWKNLYNSVYYGYNRGAKKIFMNGNLLSFGGFGYWYQNYNLIRFDFQQGEWELLSTSANPYNGLLSLEGNSLISYGGECKQLDLKTFQSRHIPDCGITLEKDSMVNLTTLEFKSYTINLQHRIAIQKSTRHAFRLPQNEFSTKFQRNVVLQTFEDSLIWWSRSERISVKSDYVKLKSLSVKVPVSLGSKMITSSSVNSLLHYMVLLGLVLIIFLVFWYWKSNVTEEHRSIHQSVEDVSVLPVIESLIQVANSPLSIESLDKIFGIHTLPSQDTQRYKRAQLIREINKYYTSMHGRELIQRRPDPEDGRKYIYLIQPV